MDRIKVAEQLVKLAKELVSKKITAGHHKQGGKWYVDSNFVNLSKSYPGGRLEHMGFGEFYLDTPDGRLDFDRMRGRDFEGQTGRSHLLSDDSNGKLVEKVIKFMERAGNSERIASRKTAADTYTFWSDPGHAWLEVKREELEDLGIERKISHFSYQHPQGIVFLEEDSDAGVFIKAKKKRGESVRFRERHEDGDIFIRNLRPYRP